MDPEAENKGEIHPNDQDGQKSQIMNQIVNLTQRSCAYLMEGIFEKIGC